MLTVYGSELCPDCVAAKKQLEEKGISFAFKNITEELSNLKEFLQIRDVNPVFEDVKKNVKIGIPCFVKEDGCLTLDPEEILADYQPGKACSLDGKGC